MLLTVPQFPQPQLNGVPCESGGASNSSHAAIAEFLGFGGGPLAPRPFVQDNFQRLELAPDPFDSSCVVHLLSMAESAASENPKVTTLFLPAPFVTLDL